MKKRLSELVWPMALIVHLPMGNQTMTNMGTAIFLMIGAALLLTIPDRKRV